MLSKKQEEIVNSEYSKIVVCAAAASGKALENGSFIYTTDGPIKIEQAKIGQKIYGEDGKLHNIIGVYPQGKKKKYIIQFSDGTEISCCEDHLWTFQTETLRSKKSKTWITASLKEIMDKYPLFKNARAKNNFGNNFTKRKNIFIPMSNPIEFKKKELPIKPYLLGALLGDGKIGGRGITSSFSNEDTDILELVNSQLNEIGYELHYTKDYDYNIVQQNYIYGKVGKFILILENLGLDNTNSGNKFIPNIYKYSSIDDRIELLKGIIDTDGYCEGSSYDLVLKSKQLILDVQELCESLGLTATYSEKKAICTNSNEGAKDCGTVYRLRIKTSKQFPKLHRSKKRESQWKPSKVYAHRAIINIIKTNEEVEMTCIKVDNPTSLFITNHFIVTHNTACITERTKTMLARGVRPERMVVITFTNAAADEMNQRIGKVEGLFIGTIHSYAYHLLCAGGYFDLAKKYADEEKFDNLFQLVLMHSSCLKPVDYLIVDEAQDCSENQWNFFELLKPAGFFYCGDPRQSIYTWRDAKPEMFQYIMYQKDVMVYSLNENYRNGRNILNFAKSIISRQKRGIEDDSVPMRPRSGSVEWVEFNINLIPSIIENEKIPYGDWFVLTRTNDQIEQVQYVLDKFNIPNITFKRGGKSFDEMNELIHTDKVKILTVHTAKGLEADNVIVIGTNMWRDEEIRLSYVAATRARNKLFWMKNKKVNKKVSNWE